MAAIGPVITTISAVATVAGTFMAYQGAKAAGAAAEGASNFEAQQIEIKSREEKADAQQKAQEQARRTALLASAFQAAAAKSGFIATGETEKDIAGEIEEYGTFQTALTYHGGTVRQKALERSAQGRRMTGAAQKQGSDYAAVGTLLSGISSMSKYTKPQSKLRYG